MIELGEDAVDVPQLIVGAQIPAGRVFVVDGSLAPQLADGEKAVLTAEGGERELTTLAEAGGITGGPGTFLNLEDYDSFGGKRADPRLRAYGWHDGWRKVKSRKGWILIVTTLLGLFLAGYGAVLAKWGESPTSAATVAERSQTLVRWVATPADGGGPAGREVAQREARAQLCLTELRGGEAKVEKVAGVECEPDDPPYLLNKDKKTLLTALVGLATALLGAFGVRDKFRFGQQPS